MESEGVVIFLSLKQFIKRSATLVEMWNVYPELDFFTEIPVKELCSGSIN
jgi:hypothetical protein